MRSIRHESRRSDRLRPGGSLQITPPAEPRRPEASPVAMRDAPDRHQEQHADNDTHHPEECPDGGGEGWAGVSRR